MAEKLTVAQSLRLVADVIERHPDLYWTAGSTNVHPATVEEAMGVVALLSDLRHEPEVAGGIIRGRLGAASVTVFVPKAGYEVAPVKAVLCPALVEAMGAAVSA